MTAEQKAAYLASGGTMCPFCDSHNISAGKLDSEGTGAYQEVECKDCEAEWNDVFTLVDVTTNWEEESAKVPA
jgi:transcription elongation factor Elf1